MSTIAAAIEEEAPNQSPETIQDNYHKMSRAELLSKLISQELDLMTTKDVSPQAAKDRIDQLCVHINQARTKFNNLQTKNGPSSSSSSSTSIAAGNGDLELERDLQLLNKEVRVLKSMFPFCLFKKPNTTDPHINWRDRSTPHFVSSAPDKLMQNLMNNENFNRTPTPQELEASLEGINNNMRLVLACFLVFPQNAIMKKSLLLCWAELCFAVDQGSQLIHDLIAKGLIHPVYKDTLTVGGYWMHPFVHSTFSDRYRWTFDKVMYVTDNSSEDIFYDDPTPFFAKRGLQILHLGNWQRFSLRHIEVEDPNSFFKDMAKLWVLRYVSLRGVSLVTEMPQFITKLRFLETLDLKSCHNLEALPSSIGNLASSLTHLDMSECYFLEDMPMALSSLRRLRVLKGFVVPEDSKENSCTLQDLLFLQDLMKLNIYTSVRSFPNRNELEALAEFRSLSSLTISWGGCSLPKKETGNSGAIATTYAIEHQLHQERRKPTTTCIGRLKRLLVGTDSQSSLMSHVDSIKLLRKKYYGPFSFYRLDKLDLQCVPETVTHDWLNPTNFQNLKKLYIRGGRFCDLGQEEGEYPWNVEILRLKHLKNLDMDYRVLERLFPKLMCLENVNCPNLKNFPCSDGVWKDNTKPPPTTYELQTRNGPSSSSSAIAAGNGDPELERDLQLLNKEVSVLKSMPFCLFKKSITTDPHINWRDRSTPHFVSAAPDKLMHNLITSDYFNSTPTAQELEASLEGINSYMRHILACFLAFPHNAIMKKSLLVRWAEVHTDGDGAPHQIHELITKGLIHPVYKDTLTVGGYWMHPFVRSSLFYPTYWVLDKMCVTDDSSEDIVYDDPTRFLAKRELCILHLGKWQRSSVRHIEVEDPNSFFKDMAKLSDLRYVSLRGISVVTELPQFITKLKVLQTLDLKSCHNLEVIPSSIGNLASSLTHLDMSECYLLEDMPMALSELRCLRVLKGFVVPADIMENSCTLRDLLSLQNLRKLNIYTSVRSFPNKDEQQTLKLFSLLRSLTISWGGCSLPRKEIADSGSTATTYAIEHQRRHEEKSHVPVSFDRLDKLDLQCIPQTITKDWLNPANFRNLKKLYIRGGRFCDLGQEEASRRQELSDLRLDNSSPELQLPGGEHLEDYRWNVEILRLKHLENLEMDYRVLQCLFPKLICLENVKCPNLKNFPCNDGVWKDNTKPPPTTYI